jgi:acyl transferase domain-containing protein
MLQGCVNVSPRLYALHVCRSLPMPMLCPTLYAGMLSPEGRCKTLDAAADGYVRAEAAGCIVIVPERAVQGSDYPGLPTGMLLLAATAVNQDGRSSSLTAPNGPSQAAVIHAALTAAGVPPSAVGLLEMHGTGTPLGDPIEVRLHMWA